MKFPYYRQSDSMNYEKFNAAYPAGQSINVDTVLKKHESWMKESNIAFTPTIFNNGRELPSQYKTGDLLWLVHADPEIFSEQETELMTI